MKVEIKVPSVGESVNSAVIGPWSKSSGDLIQRDEVIVLLETDKASMEIPAEHAGKIEILKKEGEEVLVGEVIGTIDTSVKVPDSKPAPTTKIEQPKAEQPTPQPEQPVKQPQPKTPSVQKKWDPSDHSPSVRHALMEQNIDPSTLKGSGKGGRLQLSDLKQTPSTSTSSPTSSPSSEVRREKMTTIRKRIAERLVHSQKSTATLTTFNEVDMTRIIQLRKKLSGNFPEKI